MKKLNIQIVQENEHLQFEKFVAYFTGHFDKPCNGIGENRGDRGVSNSGHFGGSEDHFSLEKKTSLLSGVFKDFT